MSKGYITKKSTGIDAETGLEKEIRVTAINIDSVSQTITVSIGEYLVSPTGIVIKALSEKVFSRYNGATRQKYDELEQSPIGVGIINMLQPDLDNYPAVDQQY
jgi:hypothetical protein